jgi:hypothetical protein
MSTNSETWCLHNDLTMGGMLAQNIMGKCDQPINYTYWFFNIVKYNHTITKCETMLVMVYVL